VGVTEIPKNITSEFILTSDNLIMRKLKDYDDAIVFYTQALLMIIDNPRFGDLARQHAKRTIQGANSILGHE